ncbi:unnamed protein product [Tenebrio molitor]|nr:unnamed protein product [Tenebrio molitor]
MFVRADTFLIVVLLKVVQIATNNIIDVDDILAEDYMPGTLLMLENPKGAIRNFNDSVGGDLTSREGDGTFDEAMETMGFHRSKMNEYLCRNYVAEEIIGDMTLSRIKRRMGSNTHGIQTHAKDKVSVKNQLLQDEGSSNYKDWLSKSTTLEDIYRHYDNVNNRVDDHGEDADKDDELNEDYDGQIMGYSFHQQQQGGPPAKLGHSGFSGGGGGYPYPQSGPHGHPGFSGHGVQEPEPIIHEQPKYHVVHEESHSEKEHDLSDLFDIALTALAYLSFGMFIIHVIMCISMAHNNASTATGMMMPMSMSPTSTGMTGTATGRDPVNLRLKRDMPTITNPNNEALNELARRILTSIEAAFVANDDDGNCLRQTLCENNKFSRSVEGNNKILIPVWSLGMSWMSGRLTKNVNPATSMLDSLKASILGLGKANCEIIYQNCNLREEKRQRRRRRKRNSEKK